MIEIKNLSHSFGSKNVLDDISFKMEKGTLNLIKGQNGVGKTTLFKCLVSIYYPNKGSVNLLDKQNEIGYMPSNNNAFFDNLTGRENLELFCGLNKLSKTETRDFIKGWENEKEFIDTLNTKFLICSDGMKQKLNFIRAMIGNRKILVLDEPFKNIDKETVLFMMNYLNRIKSDKTILLSSHLDLDLSKFNNIVEL